MEEITRISDIIMQQYERLSVFLGSVFDSSHEFAVLDLRPEHHCITAIEHGHNSGRKPGAPITDLALGFIRDETWKKQDFICNYSGTANNTTFVSSSFFITYEDTLLGMFCININIEKTANLEEIYQEMAMLTAKMRAILPPRKHADTQTADSANLSASHISETLTDSLAERLDQAILQCIPDPSLPLERLTQKEKMNIVGKLSEMKFFLVKGSVSETASRLNCSEATIYRYISKLEKKS